jgi:hypothetical protein
LLIIRSRHSALSRTFAALILLWVGFDLGAHGIFASDFMPIATGNRSVRLGPENSGAPAPDHCFCHSISMGAVVTAPASGLTPTGTLVLAISLQVPPTDPHPLDRPPQHTA